MPRKSHPQWQREGFGYRKMQVNFVGWSALFFLFHFVGTVRAQIPTVPISDPPSDSPSYVPSTAPVLNSGRTSSPTLQSVIPTVAQSSVPTSVQATPEPTSIPICPAEWTRFQTCFANEMDEDAASECDVCVGESFPQRGSSCETYSTSLCSALSGPDSCNCGACADDIELFLACVFDDLDLECDISCGLLESPTPTPTSGGDQVNAEGDASAIQGQKGTSSAHGLSNSVGMTMMAMALVVHVF